MQDYRYGFIDGALFALLIIFILAVLTYYSLPKPEAFTAPVVDPDTIKTDPPKRKTKGK
jgi:hypothetical protein